MTTGRYTYQHLLDIVDGDDELIARLIEEGEIEIREPDVALVDIDRVLITRTLVRDLDIDWTAIDVVLRLVTELADARRRIAELERAAASETS